MPNPRRRTPNRGRLVAQTEQGLNHLFCWSCSLGLKHAQRTRREGEGSCFQLISEGHPLSSLSFFLSSFLPRVKASPPSSSTISSSLHLVPSSYFLILSRRHSRVSTAVGQIYPLFVPPASRHLQRVQVSDLTSTRPSRGFISSVSRA